MDKIEFTRAENGMQKEYEKVLRNEIDIFLANGRTKESLKIRYDELRNRKERYLEESQIAMIEITLQEKALAEIRTNLNNKDYWKDSW